MIKGPLLSPAACGPHQPGCCTQRNSAPYELGQRTSFWVAAGVVAHTLWTSAAPAMTYPLFAEEWHLTHTVTTGVFAIYPIVVAAVLVGFGDVSDYVGRRAAILWGVGASLVGTLLFALAPDVLWLFAGRAFMGIGVGLTAGPSTAAPGSGEARRHDHNRGPSRRFRSSTAARRRPHPICSAAHAAELLGTVSNPSRPVYRGMVPASPDRQRGPGPLASQNPRHTETFAQHFRGRGGGGNLRVHTW